MKLPGRQHLAQKRIFWRRTPFFRPGKAGLHGCRNRAWGCCTGKGKGHAGGTDAADLPGLRQSLDGAPSRLCDMVTKALWQINGWHMGSTASRCAAEKETPVGIASGNDARRWERRRRPFFTLPTNEDSSDNEQWATGTLLLIISATCQKQVCIKRFQCRCLILRLHN